MEKEKETTLINMLMDLNEIIRSASHKEVLEIYNKLTGYDYTYDDIDWSQ